MVKAEESQPHHHDHHVRIKIKGPTPINKNKNKKNVQQQPCYYLCGFCNKGFTSVYALNGHTRMHSPHSDNNNNNVVKTYDGTNTFPSDKSLFSHMINTTVRREITPCQNISSGRRFNIAAAEHSDDYLSDGSVFRSWPLSCKRIRKPRLSPRRRRRGNSCSEVEVDPLMQEAAYTLMLLANGVLHSSTPGGVLYNLIHWPHKLKCFIKKRCFSVSIYKEPLFLI